jgi:predicted protein tyrosine phosphatase
VTLLVSPLSQVRALYEARRPARVITLLSPGSEAVDLPGHAPGQRLSLFFHDIAENRDGYQAPAKGDIERILEFGLADPARPLLIHCWAGISRSTAAAFILSCARNPILSEEAIAGRLRQASPMATPNPLMVALADDLLGRRGRMAAAIAAIGRGAEAFEGAPFELD